jgi:hypothetical protein
MPKARTRGLFNPAVGDLIWMVYLIWQQARLEQAFAVAATFAEEAQV